MMDQVIVQDEAAPVQVHQARPVVIVQRQELAVIAPEAPAPRVVVQNGSRVVGVVVRERETLQVGLRGIQGPRGLPGASAERILTAVAGMSLSALRAIIIDASGRAIYAQPTLETVSGVVGVTVTAADAPDEVSYRTSGHIEGFSFAQRGAVYLGPNGTLTQDPPTSGVTLELGVSLSSSELLLRVQQPIFMP